MFKKKIFQVRGLNQHTAPTIRKEDTLGYAARMSPKSKGRGGYMMPAPALDLTALFEVICGKICLTIPQYHQFMTVHFHRDILFNVNR